MQIRPEPPYQPHATPPVTLLLCNLGTPDAPTAKAVRRYLREFLSDYRVVEIPRLVWWFILNGIILVTRPKQSAAKYASIWMEQGSPLLVWTQRLVQSLQRRLHARPIDATLKAFPQNIQVRLAMRYGNPAIDTVMTELAQQGVPKILVVPAYPQYSATTTASISDRVNHWLAQCRNQPEMRFIKHYHDHPAYIRALASLVHQHWETNGRGELLLLSFHGLPKRNLMLGDPYYCECQKTARLLKEALGLSAHQVQVTFQSRLGRAKWLEPYTEPTLRQLARDGLKRVDVMCPGFVVDCLETLEEIAMEGRNAFLTSGGHTFHYIPCLNDAPVWVDALLEIAQPHLNGWEPIPHTTADKERALSNARALGAPH